MNVWVVRTSRAGCRSPALGCGGGRAAGHSVHTANAAADQARDDGRNEQQTDEWLEVNNEACDPVRRPPYSNRRERPHQIVNCVSGGVHPGRCWRAERLR